MSYTLSVARSAERALSRRIHPQDAGRIRESTAAERIAAEVIATREFMEAARELQRERSAERAAGGGPGRKRGEPDQPRRRGPGSKKRPKRGSSERSGRGLSGDVRAKSLALEPVTQESKTPTGPKVGSEPRFLCKLA